MTSTSGIWSHRLINTGDSVCSQDMENVGPESGPGNERVAVAEGRTDGRRADC